MVKKSHFYQLNSLSLSLNILFFIFVPSVSFSHGLNVRYELPIPLYIYLISSAFIIFVTLLFSKYFLNKYIEASKNIAERHLYNNKWIGSLGFTVILFLIYAGYYGDQGPLNNIINVLIWVWFWVGFAYLSIFSGRFWPKVNPWFSPFSFIIRSLYQFKWIKKIRRKSIREISILGIILLIIFVWFAIVYPGREVPKNLSLFLIIYSFITFLGMLIYGRVRWFAYAEIFSIYFGMLGRIGIFSPYYKNKKYNIRMPFSGILMGKGSIYSAIFIIIAVASISFDGVLETKFWYDFKVSLISNFFFIPILKLLLSWFGNLEIILDSLGIIFMPIVLALFFSLSCVKGLKYFKQDYTIKKLIIIFAPSLIPIAAAYHVAHYFSFLLIAGQLAFPLLSDPLNLGWDLFGTENYKVNPYVINAKIGWSVILFSVIVGHMGSIVISQKIAYTLVVNKKNAIKAHLPLSFFMILYTIFSLWILSEPIVH